MGRDNKREGSPVPEDVGRWIEEADRELETNQGHSSGLKEDLKFYRAVEEAKTRDGTVFRRLPLNIDPHDLSQTGWAVLFSKRGKQQFKSALEPLLARRTEQAGARYKCWVWGGETVEKFCADKVDALGVVRPERLPYYVLIVSDPDDIPYSFQYYLSLNHAVGRLHFDGPQAEEACRDYVQKVLRSEKDRMAWHRPRRAEIFSVHSPEDYATNKLHKFLADPLSETLHGFLKGTTPKWSVELKQNREASRQALEQSQARPPALFFGCCHGLQKRFGDPRQSEEQGALICHGPEVPQRQRLFRADEVRAGTDLQGQIAFLFACFGAGTPVADNFPPMGPENSADGAEAPERPDILAPRPFVARLPQALLRRGAMAVLGHVDRGWIWSFVWQELKGHAVDFEYSATSSLEDAVKRLLWGERLGHALRPLYERYAALAARLVKVLDNTRQGKPTDPTMTGRLWTAVNDARNFVVLGDPAVYLLGQRARMSGDVQLEPQILRFASERAAAEKQSLERWVNSVIWNKAVEEGYKLK